MGQGMYADQGESSSQALQLGSAKPRQPRHSAAAALEECSDCSCRSCVQVGERRDLICPPPAALVGCRWVLPRQL